LVYCFPTLSDDIRMRLYLADIPTRHGPLPAVKFFWNAFSRTSIFSKITSDADTALAILRQRPTSEADSTWHREWRTILLFLELYIFVLRLTDDDDFFSGLSVSADFETSTSRLRSSGLGQQNLKKLTTFLKHLGFPLYYNAAELLGSTNSTPNTADGFPGSSARPTSVVSSNVAAGALSFTLTAGVDFEAFRNLVSTAMRMLYERDSRRKFLPQNHWLMTSKFDMEGFLSAVVLEEQSQREQAEAEDEDDEDEMDVEEAPITLSAGGLRLSRQAHMERIRVSRKRAARDILRAAAGPKLEILRNMPFVIPFDMRVQIFRQFVHLDKHRRRGGNIDPDRWRLWVLNQHGGLFEPTPMGQNIIGRHQAQIQRGQVFHDAMESFWGLEEKLKEPIQITFVDEFGIQEAGIDGGGVTKEFLLSVTSEAFTPGERLFVANNKNSYYPNPCDMDQTRNTLREAQIPEGSEDWNEAVAYRQRQYEFLGRVIGKCLYEGVLIDISFAGFFLLKWASSSGAADTYRANINDLRELDEELYQGMLRLKNYPGDVRDLSLDFTLTDQISLPGEPVRTVTRNLVPNGEDVPVTNENRPLYISYVARHRLVVQPYAQTRAFLRGLGMIIDPAWLSMFNQNELQRLVGGDSSEINVEDLRKHTVYSGVYAIGDDGEEHPTVKMFWEVMRGLEDGERRDVLKYVTSTPRAPLLGFSQLSPPFSIRDGGGDEERLPSASTCVNLLKLPRYQSAMTLKKKLLYAVTSGAGFDLS
jgi:ubiquitin-protein ligase E3 C